MRSATARGPYVALVLALVGCSREPEPTATRAASTEGSGSVPRRAEKAAAPSVAYAPPKRWEKTPPQTGFRKDAYRVPRADGDDEDGDLSVSVAGGSVEMNVDRWEKQLVPAEGDPAGATQKKTAGDLKLTLIERWGTYNGGPMMGAKGGSKKGWGLLGAVVELPQGKGLWFFKLVGPRKTLEGARKEFNELVDSFRLSG